MSNWNSSATPNGRPQSGIPGPISKSKQIKLVLLGESGVGKSSIALRFVRGEFNENGDATIGAAFLTKTINCAGTSIKFDIWDTAGQERYHSLAPMYYRGAPAAVVAYDITSNGSFQRAMSWVKELLQQANSQMVIFLAGNKADMASEKRHVTKEEAQEFANENRLFFAETSAKTGMNIDDIFYKVGNTIAQTGPVPGGGEPGRSTVKLKKQEKEKGCC